MANKNVAEEILEHLNLTLRNNITKDINVNILKKIDFIDKSFSENSGLMEKIGMRMKENMFSIDEIVASTE